MAEKYSDYRIPEHIVDQVIDRSDIVSVIGRYVSLKKKGKDYFGLCPFHEEKTPSFSVSPTKQRFYCFGCHKGGTVITFLMEHLGLGFREAVKELAAESGVTIPQGRNEGAGHHEGLSREQKKRLDELLQTLAAFYHEQLRSNIKPQQYLYDRGISGKIAKRYLLGYSPENPRESISFLSSKGYTPEDMIVAGVALKTEQGVLDRFADRLVFPIQDQTGRVCGFSGRIISSEQSSTTQPKYVNSAGNELFDKGTTLYGLAQAMPAIKKTGRILIVEGYLDVLTLVQHGFEYAVASMGTALTSVQIRTAIRLASDVLVCLDGDEAGLSASMKSLPKFAEAIRDGDSIRYVFLPNGYDPDEAIRTLGTDEFAQMLDQAPAFSELLLKESGMAVIDDDQLERRIKWVTSVMEIIDRMTLAPITRKAFIRELKKQSGIDPLTKEVLSGSAEEQEKQLLKSIIRMPFLIHNTPLEVLTQAQTPWGRCCNFLVQQVRHEGKRALEVESLFSLVQGTAHEKVFRQCAFAIDLTPVTDIERVILSVIHGKIILRLRKELLARKKMTPGQQLTKREDQELEIIETCLENDFG